MLGWLHGISKTPLIQRTALTIENYSVLQTGTKGQAIGVELNGITLKAKSTGSRKALKLLSTPHGVPHLHSDTKKVSLCGTFSRVLGVWSSQTGSLDDPNGLFCL